MKVRVVLADDHILVLEGLQKLLEPLCEVVGTVTDGRALVQLALALRPEVVLVEVCMPLLNGLNAIEELKAKIHEIKAICQRGAGGLAGKSLRVRSLSFWRRGSP